MAKMGRSFCLDDGVFTFRLGLPLEDGKARCWRELGQVASILSGWHERVYVSLVLVLVMKYSVIMF
jgi:hypothetical protein